MGRHRAAPSPSTTSRGRPGSPRRRCPAPSPVPGRVNAATAERIRQVADDLGYRANPLARALSTARSHMIALVVSDVGQPVLLRDHPRRADRRGRRPATRSCSPTPRSPTGWSGRRWSACCPPSTASSSAGSRMSDSAIRMIAKQKPVVVLNRAVVDVPSVVPDNAARYPARGRAPVAAGARRRSPTSPGRRRPGPTGCAGGRCRTRPAELQLQRPPGRPLLPRRRPAACAPPRSCVGSRRRRWSPTTTSWRSG